MKFRSTVSYLLEAEGKLVYWWNKNSNMFLRRSMLDHTNPFKKAEGKLFMNPESRDTDDWYKIFRTMVTDVDPTVPQFKYLAWIMKTYMGDLHLHWEYMTTDVAKWIQNFDRAKKAKLIHGLDINRLGYVELAAMNVEMERLLSLKRNRKSESQKARAESKVMLDDSQYRVIWIRTQFAAEYYGRHTKWCTTSGGTFNSYNARGNIYVIIPKHGGHDGEKYQLHVKDSGGYEYHDEEDRSAHFKDLPLRKTLAKAGVFLQWNPKYDELMLRLGGGNIPTSHLRRISNPIGIERKLKMIEFRSQGIGSSDFDTVLEIVDAVLHKKLKVEVPKGRKGQRYCVIGIHEWIVGGESRAYVSSPRPTGKSLVTGSVSFDIKAYEKLGGPVEHEYDGVWIR